MKTIVTLTMNPAVDMFLEVPRLLSDRKLRCETPLFGPGGGGINMSRHQEARRSLVRDLSRGRLDGRREDTEMLFERLRSPQEAVTV